HPPSSFMAFSSWLMHRLCRGGVGMLVDGVDDLRPHRDRQRVTHAFDHHQFRTGNGRRGILAAGGMNQRIDGAMDHKRWRLDGAESLLAAAGGENGAKLAAD